MWRETSSQVVAGVVLFIGSDSFRSLLPVSTPFFVFLASLCALVLGRGFGGAVLGHKKAPPFRMGLGNCRLFASESVCFDISARNKYGVSKSGLARSAREASDGEPSCSVLNRYAESVLVSVVMRDDLRGSLRDYNSDLLRRWPEDFQDGFYVFHGVFYGLR